jgi:hypothetical protein
MSWPNLHVPPRRCLILSPGWILPELRSRHGERHVMSYLENSCPPGEPLRIELHRKFYDRIGMPEMKTSLSASETPDFVSASTNA